LNVRFGTRRTCLVGLRLGATLALLTNLRQQHAGILVLWDPVSDGCRYLEELRERQSGMPYLSGNAVRRGRAAEDQLELLGFLYSSSLVKDIDALNLWRLDRGPGSTILMVDGSAGRGHQPLAAHLTAQGAHIEYQHLPDGEPWSQMNYNKAVIPSRAIEGIVGWLKESTR